MPELGGASRTLLSCVLWPMLYASGLAGSYVALASDFPLLGFNIVYLMLVLLIVVFERFMPHERRWLLDDGETADNLAHTVFTKGVVQLAAAIAPTLVMATALIASGSAPASGIWPREWPLAAQVVLGLFVAEFGLYVAHRLAHEWPGLWRFHALHHSVPRLWVINTGRFHIVDSFLKIALSLTPLYLMGAPLPVYLWISAVTAVTGLLTHCNIEMRTGSLDYVFSTPKLHRWHHSKVLDEGNRNYGENLVIWDLLFGTYCNPRRRPPVDIGIHGRIAPGFFAQIVQPFSASGVRQIRGDA